MRSRRARWPAGTGRTTALVLSAAICACHGPAPGPTTTPSTAPARPAPSAPTAAASQGQTARTPDEQTNGTRPPVALPGADTHGLRADPTGFPAERTDCPTFLRRGAAFRMLDERLPEVSGLVVASPPSRAFWVHNDSGDSARMLAVDHTGVLLELQLPGIDVFDAEDIALAPGAPGQPWWLYLADIGDNRLQRSSGVTLLRTPEPPVPQHATTSPALAERVERLIVHYERGPRDAEAFLVDPVRHELVLVTKGRDGTNLVLVAPERAFATGEVTAKVAAELHLGLVTAADIARDGSAILVRTYTHAWLWPRAADESVAEALSGPACPLPTEPEPQCEAAALGHDGASYFTVSEGRSQPLYRFERKPDPAANAQ